MIETWTLQNVDTTTHHSLPSLPSYPTSIPYRSVLAYDRLISSPSRAATSLSAYTRTIWIWKGHPVCKVSRRQDAKREAKHPCHAFEPATTHSVRLICILRMTLESAAFPDALDLYSKDEFDPLHFRMQGTAMNCPIATGRASSAMKTSGVRILT